METTSEREGQERRIGPTVSKEKWLNHAKAKLARGYVLIVGTERKTANFYLRNKGYEMCGYNVAKQLIKEGIVVPHGEHALGMMYRLASNALLATPARRDDDDDRESADEMDALLTQLSREQSGDSQEPAAAF